MNQDYGPVALQLFMFQNRWHWWHVDELVDKTCFTRAEILYFLKRLQDCHLIRKRKGPRSGKQFYQVINE